MDVNGDNVKYIDSFGVEHTPEEIKRFISNRDIKTRIYRIQPNDSIMCEYICNGVLIGVLKGNSLLNYTNLFAL